MATKKAKTVGQLFSAITKAIVEQNPGSALTVAFADGNYTVTLVRNGSNLMSKSGDKLYTTLMALGQAIVGDTRPQNAIERLRSRVNEGAAAFAAGDDDNL